MMPLYHPIASIFALRNGCGHYSSIWSIQKLSMFGFIHLHTPISLLFRSAVAKSLMTTKTSVIDEHPPAKKRSAFQWHSNKPIWWKDTLYCKRWLTKTMQSFSKPGCFFWSKCKQHLHKKCFKTFHGQWKWQNAYVLSFYMDKILLFMLFSHFYKNSILLKKSY